MIYSATELCSCVDCRDECGQNSQNYTGKLCTVLVSSGKIYCEETQSSHIAGALLVFSGAVEIHLYENTHVIFAALSGAAAEKAAESVQRVIVSDCGACPMAAEILTMLLEEKGEIQRAKLSFELLCELAQANEKQANLPALVAAAINEMHKSYAQMFGIEELASTLGVSKSHLVRVFSTSLGLPPGQYLTRVRIDAAKLLLSKRNYSLELIATLCGFSGANYLCKVFRRETGQTPAAYRRACGEKAARPALINDIEGTLYV